MKQKIERFIADRLGADNVALTSPKDPSFGHFATPIAFTLAASRRAAPNAIATELSQKLRDDEYFSEVSVVGGFINFKLSDRFLDLNALEALRRGDRFGAIAAGATESAGGEKILLEFVSANPTGPLHIGHARGAFYGDSLLKLGRHLGHTIVSEYYINDAGNQVDLLGRSVHFKGRAELLNEAIEFPSECYQGEYILDLAKLAQKRFGDAIFQEGADISALCVWAKDEMIKWIKTTLGEADIVFDNFVSEKPLYDRWDKTMKRLEENGALYADSDRKIWLASSKKGDGKDRVVARENGVPTYLAGDIIYHDDKFARGFDRYINIWGADHHGYIPRVKAAIEFLGYDSNKLEVLLSQMVSLLKNGEPYKMSKRSGNFVTMEEIGNEAGYDALRFIFLTKRADTHLEFDINLLKKEDSSNPIYYVNYAHARICSLFEKLGKKPYDLIETPLDNLQSDAKELVFFALQLPETIKESFKTRQPHLLTDYLYKLAVKTHKFYADNRVIGSKDEERFAKILSLSALSIRIGLKLLGINAKTSM
ncbi:MAG: arginine--tRNA ligase [Helicobacteraceae bacterium]|nr:arginine--tRNA ligase [Helicobacteraceae bacterium]